MNTNTMSDHNKMPFCSESILLNLIGQYLIKENDLELLQERLKIEDLYSETMKKLFENLTLFVSKGDYPSASTTLKEMQLNLRDIDIQLLIKLTNMNDESLKIIKERNIYLLMGLTGSGKSTTLHFLGGSKMENKPLNGQFHIAPTVITNQYLQKVTTSPTINSETKNIIPVIIQLDPSEGFIESEAIFCDSPGFEDSNGTEIDISNSIAIATAVQNCSGLKPIIITSKLTGDRFERLEVLTQIIAGMFKNLQQDIKYFSYIYTKFAKEDNQLLKNTLMNINNSLKEKTNREEIDSSFKFIIEDMIKKQRKQLTILDPLTDDPSEIIKLLVDDDFITNPARSISISLSEKSKRKLDSQMQKHFIFVEKSLQRFEYELAVFKLKELNQLKSIVCDRDVNQKFEILSRNLIENLNKKYSECIEKFNQKISHHLSEQDVTIYFECLKSAKSSELIYIELNENYAKKFEQLSDNLISRIKSLNEKLTNTDITNFEVIRINLDNLTLIAINHEFKTEDLVNICQISYNKMYDIINEKINNYIESAREDFSTNKFQVIARHLSVVQNLSKYLSEQFNDLLIFYSNIIKLVTIEIEKRSNGFPIDDKFTENHIVSLKEIDSYFNGAIFTLDLHQHIPIDLIESNYAKFKNSALDKFKQLIESVDRELDEVSKINQGLISFEITKNAFSQMKKLREIPEFSLITRTIYEEVLNKIVHLVQKMKCQMDQLTGLIINQKEAGNDHVKLAKNLKILEKLAWIEEYERNVYNFVKDDIQENLIQHVNRLKTSLKDINLNLDNSNQLLTIYKTIETICLNEPLKEIYPVLEDPINQSKIWFQEKINQELESIVIIYKSDSKIDYRITDKAINYIEICQSFSSYLKDDLKSAELTIKLKLSERINYIKRECDECFNAIQRTNSQNKEENIEKAVLIRDLLTEIETAQKFDKIMSYFPIDFSSTGYLNEWRARLNQEHKKLLNEIKDYKNSETRLSEKLVIAKVFSKLELFLGDEKFSDLFNDYIMIAKQETKEIYNE